MIQPIVANALKKTVVQTSTYLGNALNDVEGIDTTGYEVEVRVTPPGEHSFVSKVTI